MGDLTGSLLIEERAEVLGPVNTLLSTANHRRFCGLFFVQKKPEHEAAGLAGQGLGAERLCFLRQDACVSMGSASRYRFHTDGFFSLRIVPTPAPLNVDPFR